MSDLENAFLTIDEKINLLFGQVSRIILYLNSKDPNYSAISHELLKFHNEKIKEFSPEYVHEMYAKVKEFSKNE